MEELKFQDKPVKQYAELMDKLKTAHPDIVGVSVDVSIDGGDVKLSIGNNILWLKPEQTVDLIKQLRRAVVKIKPKLLRP
jgi:hypothetical protein